MYDTILMQILETEHDAAYKKFDDMFWKSLVFANLEAQVASGHIVHDEVKIVPILESKDHVD